VVGWEEGTRCRGRPGLGDAKTSSGRTMPPAPQGTWARAQECQLLRGRVGILGGILGRERGPGSEDSEWGAAGGEGGVGAGLGEADDFAVLLDGFLLAALFEE